MRAHTFGLQIEWPECSMYSKLTVPNVVCGFFKAERS